MMDPRTNPYAPGAGTPPPELAGRDDVIERAAISLDRLRGRFPTRGMMLYGLRGVGKTVLLNRIQRDAEARGIASVRVKANERRSLPASLAPALRAALLNLHRSSAAGKARDAGARALVALAGFIQAVKVRYADVEVGLDFSSERGLADSGDLEADLSSLLARAGEAAAEREGAIVLFVDELQYVPEKELASLITALHAATQAQLPVAMVAAGLPQLLGLMGKAKSYAERLFEFVPIGQLDQASARDALAIPAERKNVSYEPAAIETIIAETHGYPYFLQEWGKHSWNIARESPIQMTDARRATDRALDELDASFFRVRFDQLTPVEKRYMRAMAELGPGPHKSGEVAEKFGRSVTGAAPLRNGLIRKGIIFSPRHGDTAFTVPMFDGFLKRIMPDF